MNHNKNRFIIPLLLLAFSIQISSMRLQVSRNKEKDIITPNEIQRTILECTDLRSRMHCRQVCKNWQINIDGGLMGDNYKIGINQDIQVYLDILKDSTKDKEKRIKFVLFNALYDKQYDLIECLIEKRTSSPIKYITHDMGAISRIYNPLDFAYRIKDTRMIHLLQKYGYTSWFYRQNEEKSCDEDDDDYECFGPNEGDEGVRRKFPKNPLLLDLLLLPFLIKEEAVNLLLDQFKLKTTESKNALIENNRGGITWTEEAEEIFESVFLFIWQYDNERGVAFVQYLHGLRSFDQFGHFIGSACHFKCVKALEKLLSINAKRINDFKNCSNDREKENNKTWRDIILEHDKVIQDEEYKKEVEEILNRLGAKHYKQIVEERTPEEQAQYDIQQLKKRAQRLENDFRRMRLKNEFELDAIEGVLNAGPNSEGYAWACLRLRQLKEQFHQNNSTQAPDRQAGASQVPHNINKDQQKKQQEVSETKQITRCNRLPEKAGKPRNILITNKQKLFCFTATSALLASLIFLIKHFYQTNT